MSNLSNFENILAPHADGLYTHLYAECGYLDKPTAFVYEKLPGNRDVFDLSSLTKALVTVPLIYQESLLNKLDLRSKVGEWLEGHVDHYDLNINAIMMLQLLRHESGLPAWRNLWVNHFDEKGRSMLDESERKIHIDKIINAQFLLSANQFIYSDIGFLLLQRLLENRYNAPFKTIYQAFCETMQFGELITFDPDPAKAVSTGFCEVRGRELVGEVHDENAAVLGGACGHAGAFATGPNLVVYLKKLLTTNVGKAIWKEHKEALQLKQVHPGLAGWWLGNGESSKVFAGGKAIGHLGFTGTAFWVDTNTRAYGVLLTNRVISGRISHRITKLRKDVFTYFNKCLRQ